MLKMKHNQMEQALELVSVVLSHPASLQETKDRADRLCAELESRLTPIEFEAIQARVGKKTFEAVVEAILK